MQPIAGSTVTVHHGGRDLVALKWVETGTDVITDVPVDWTSTSETTADNEQTVVNATIYPPAGSPIGATDQVTIDGGSDRYQVVGDPAAWRSPFTGWAPGMSVRLELIRG